jgi:membrane-associated protease RseP (regulator of RpoE activity)
MLIAAIRFYRPRDSGIRLNEFFRVWPEIRKALWVASSSPQSSALSVPAYPLDFGSLKSLIEYRFNLLDAYVDVTGTPIFLVAEEPVKEKFQELLHDLGNHGLVGRIRRVRDKLAIMVFPKPKLGQPRKLINLVLFIATVGTVALASYLLIFDVDPRLASALYANANLGAQVFVLAASILGIVVLHEMGHVMVVRRHKMDATLPYFVPAPPPFPFGTFGAVISLRGPPSNRDQLFDLGFSGPIAGFITTIGVAVLAYLTAPLIAEPQVTQLVAANLLSAQPWPHMPLLLELIGWLNLRTVPVGYVLVLNQVAFAAEVGALITFLNILPVWQLDGGHIARAVLGSQGHKITAFIAFGVLVAAGYWGFALLLIVFMIASRRPLEGLEPLDDVSPLSNSRKALFGIALLILLLSFFIF